MKVRYHPLVRIFPVILGGVSLFPGLWLAALGEFNLVVVPGLVLTLIGIILLARPYFWLDATSIELVGLIRPGTRMFPFETLEIVEGKWFAVNHGNRIKLPVARWKAHSGDWAMAMERIAELPAKS